MNNTGFAELNLSKELLKAVAALGFEEPSPIQALAIPPILEGRDVVGQAQTGTGKTAAFGLPLLELVSARSKKTQALILCPTRELAMQVSEELSSFAANTRGIAILPVYGGQSLERQIRALSRGVQIIVGTPGRVIDHIERGTVILDQLRTLVLDEADEMLDMGFRDDIERVLKSVPEGCQKVCFSATMPKAILALVKSYMQEPEFVKITQKQITVPNIEQIYYAVRPHQKTDALSLVLDSQDIKKGIVFCSTKRGVDDLASHLLGRGYQADALHGNLSQAQRDRVMDRFRSSSLELLIATDVAARGLDIDDVDVVINFDIPNDVENYVHRIGRTGRAGRPGRALTFVTPREQYKLRDITRYTKAEIVSAQIPSRKEVNEYKNSKLAEEILLTVTKAREESANSKKLDRYALLFEKVCASAESLEVGIEPTEIAVALLRMVIERDNGMDGDVEEIRSPSFDARDARPVGGRGGRGDYKSDYRDSKDGKRSSGARSPKGKGQGRERDERNMERLHFSVGSKNRVTPGDIVGAIAGETGVPGRVIGAIEIHDRFSFVDVPSEYAAEVVKVMNKASIRGQRLSVEQAQPKTF